MEKVWYKNKIYWISIVGVLVILMLIIDGVTYHSVHKLFHPTTRSAVVTDHNSAEGDDTATSDKNTVKLDYKSYKYSQKKTYQLNQDVNSWNYANVKINSVTIYKLAKTYQRVGLDGKEGNCLVIINMTVKANKDISFYPTQGSVSTNAGQQADAMIGNDDFDGDIDSGISKTGDVAVVYSNVNKISSIKKLRFKFDAYAQDDNDDSDNSSNSYDLDINLK